MSLRQSCEVTLNLRFGDATVNRVNLPLSDTLAQGILAYAQSIGGIGVVVRHQTSYRSLGPALRGLYKQVFEFWAQ